MRLACCYARPLALATTALAVFLGAAVGPRSGLGQAPPAAAGPGDILLAAPFDRITLTDNTVLNVEPISPRPLPVIDMAKQRELDRKKRGKKEPPPAEGNIGLPGAKKKPAAVAEPVEDEGPLHEVTIHLLEGEVRDFKVKRSNIKTVEYYEDLLLNEVDRLILAKDFARGFESCLRVQARDPKWRGLDDHVNRLLFAEGSAALLEGDGERGLRLLRELFARAKDHPGLADKLAGSYSARARRAFDIGLYARGRRILHDAEPLAPGHPDLKAVRDLFIARARDRADAARKLEGGPRLDALTEALRIWPTLEGADKAFRDAFAATPTLAVAVNDVPRQLGPWVRCPADERVTRLLYRPVLVRDDEEAQQGKAEGQLAAAVATADLGRRITVKLRPGIFWSDGSRPVAPVDLARSFTDAAEPTSFRYSGRWADLLDRIETPEEGVVEIRLTRALLKPGAWLMAPVGPAHASSDGRVAVASGGRELVDDGLFIASATGTDRVEFLVPPKARSGDASPASKIRRIVEVRYPTVATALGALNRGEVAVMEHVPADRVAALAANPDFKVGRYLLPTMHYIALDGRNPLLRNRELRRGLSYAIDRRTWLEETLLKRPPDAANVVADGIFPKGTYADAPGVKPLGYDPLLARMLVAAAKKDMNQAISLTFEYPATAEAQAVAPRIAEAWKLAGVELKLAERPESDLEAELRSGRRFDLAYRVGRGDEPAVDAGLLLSPAYDAPPAVDPLGSLASPRILQLLLQLERAPEWPTARGLVVQIDRETRDELPVLPLWQLEDHYAWHTRAKGLAEQTGRLYQGIETWEVDPWFARDPW